jgi:S1-C subfamily serine protease
MAMLPPPGEGSQPFGWGPPTGPYDEGPPPRHGAPAWLWGVIGGLAMLVVVLVVVLFATRDGGDGEAADTSLPPTSASSPTTTSPVTTAASTTTSQATTTVAPTTTLPPTTTTTLPPTIEELATRVVSLRTVDADGLWCSAGSATVVSDDGLLLTNYHVIQDVVSGGGECDGADLEVGLITSTAATPLYQYLATPVVWDEALDLAVVRIDRDRSGTPVTPSLVPVALAEELPPAGASLRAVGFPYIGTDEETGENTVTVTTGTVSGFLDNGNWIKVDAQISHGNSGGALFDDLGRLVGVPTRRGPFDEAGTIAQARPAMLAARLIEAATAGGGVTPPPSTTVPEEVAGIEITDILISPGKDGGYPLPNAVNGATVPEYPSDTQQVCVFWHVDGMPYGVMNGAIWTVDGEVLDDTSIPWNKPSSDRPNWCVPNPPGGTLPAGRHRLAYVVEDVEMFVVEFVIG